MNDMTSGEDINQRKLAVRKNTARYGFFPPFLARSAETTLGAKGFALFPQQ